MAREANYKDHITTPNKTKQMKTLTVIKSKFIQVNCYLQVNSTTITTITKPRLIY